MKKAHRSVHKSIWIGLAGGLPLALLLVLMMRQAPPDQDPVLLENPSPQSVVGSG